MKSISVRFKTAISVVLILFLSCLSAVHVAAQTMTGSGAVSSYTYGGSRSRDYSVYVPQSYDGSSPVAMIFALHGCRMDHDDARNLWNLDLIADQHNVIVVFPFVTSFSELRNTNCWGYWFSKHVQEGGGGEADDLHGMALEVESMYNIDPGRRFITGLSSGGGMVVAEAIAYSEYWTAAAPVAALPYGDWQYSVTSNPENFRTLGQYVSAINAELDHSRPMPMLLIQSSGDTTVQPLAMELIRDSQLTVWGPDLNADASESCSTGSINCTLTTYNDANGDPLIKTLLYDGVFNQQAQYGKGHYWPGTDVSVDLWANEGPSAAEYMWEFFEEIGGGGAVCEDPSDTTPPSAPTGLASTSVGSSSVQLVVNANGEADLQGYNVYTSGGSALTSSPVSSTSISVSGLAASTEFTVYAVAVDNCGNESAASSSITFTTDAGGGSGGGSAPSATDTVVNHYVAGRLDLNGYLSLGASIGYTTVVTLYQGSDGSWSQTNPGGGSGGNNGGNTGGNTGGNNGGNTGGENGGNTGSGSWSTSSSLAGMQVHTYLPNTVTSNGKRALMITLHGCSQSNENVRDGWEWEDPAVAYGMVVAAPMAPNGGVLIGCWDYYGTNHSSTSPGRHDDNLRDLANAMIGNTSLNIDVDQVYISGLSSGGGQAFVMGCLMPDIFAGMSINAGPALGTSSGQIGSVPFGTSASSVASRCESFSSNDGSFDTQITSVVHGTSDFTVGQAYAEVDAAAMGNVYGANKDSGTNSVSGGGTESTWSDGIGVRVSKVMVSGLSHAWPAGSGSGGGTYTNHSTIDYPEFLTRFLFDNNRRADFGGPTPTPTPTPTATVPPTPTPVPTVTVPPTPTPVPTATVPPTPTPTPTLPPTPTPTPTPTPLPNCNDVTAFNYYHKVGGRATSSGYYWSPNYVANGSGDSMPGSTWGLNTLHSYSGGYWSMGGCP